MLRRIVYYLEWFASTNVVLATKPVAECFIARIFMTRPVAFRIRTLKRIPSRKGGKVLFILLVRIVFEKCAFVIRFIGELFKLKMLTEHIMFDCINRLLRYCGDEDNVECLCRLLVTIGKDLDNASPTSKQRLSQSFQELKQLSSKQQLSSRIRFMIQDVLELRENDWIPRREDTKPKLIEQIHKEAEMEELHKRQQLSIQHKCHHQNSSSSIPHELQRSSSLASSGLDHHRGSFDGRSQFPGHQSQNHYQGRGSIDRSLRQPLDRFGSLERVKASDNFSGGGNGSSKLNLYATLGHSKRYNARPLTGGGSSISSSDLGRTLETLRNENVNIQLAPSSYKQQLHKPWQEGSSGGIMRQGNESESSPVPPTTLRSRGSASDIFGRTYARSPVRIAPRSRIFDPKALERDKHAAIAAAKSISSSVSADSFISSPVRASLSAKDSQLHEKSIRFSSNLISLSPRDLENQQKDLEKKCQSLLEEYLTADDLQEACLSFKEMHSTVKGDYSLMLVLTNYLVNNSLEKSNKDRQKMGILLSHLVLKNLVSVDIYLERLLFLLIGCWICWIAFKIALAMLTAFPRFWKMPRTSQLIFQRSGTTWQSWSPELFWGRFSHLGIYPCCVSLLEARTSKMSSSVMLSRPLQIAL